MMNRAYSLLEIKSLNEEQRIVEGVASTPVLDRDFDRMDPLGAKFTLPLPFLWAHDHNKGIGNVVYAKPTATGIPFRAQIASETQPGAFKDLLDRAWQELKAGVMRGTSIGFRVLPDGAKRNKEGGLDITSWEWLELSAVRISANQEASIISVKAICEAASGKSSQIILPPGVSGKTTPKMPLEGKTMAKSLEQMISELEAERGPKMTRLEEISQKSLAEGRHMTAEEAAEYDPLDAEVTDIDASLRRLKSLVAKAQDAKPVVARTQNEGTKSRGSSFAQPKQEKAEPGIAFARLAKVKAVSRLEIMPQLDVAEKMYGRDSETFQILVKAGEVLPGTAASGNWAVDLISPEGAAVADFVEYLRKGSITGRFGAGGVPALNRIGFYEPYVIQTGAGAGYWVGEAKPVPLTSFDFDRSTLTPLKLGNIAMLSERNIRYSSPSSDVVIRDQLARVLIETEDTAFIDPTNSGSANVKPAAVTNGAETIVSTGDDADAVRLDLRALLKKFTDASNPPRNGVFVMSTDSAIALGSMVNALGQPEFTGIGMDGGRLIGLPVIVSDYAGTIVALINASDIYYSDEGGVQVDVSREASIEMKDQANITQDGGAATGAAMVSTFQNLLVAMRAIKTVNWKLRRTSAVAYLTGVSWGGAVPAS